MSDKKTILIIGASRGLGFGLAEEFLKRDWLVTGTVRRGNNGQKSKLEKLVADQTSGLTVEFLDINDGAQLEALKDKLKGHAFDIIFINAGVANDFSETIGSVSTDEFNRVMTTNALSPMRVVEQLAPNVTAGGVLGLMSSGLASVTNNESGGYEVYRASKAALNTLMRSFASRQERDFAMLLLAPGWIKTDMGGDKAPFTIEETMPLIVDTIIGQSGQKGLKYLDRFNKEVPW